MEANSGDSGKSFAQLGVVQAGHALSCLIADYEKANGPLAYAEQLASEALFALGELGREIAPGQRCLEIGAGSGFFTHLLATAGVNVDAIEPIGPGFAQFRGPLAFVAGLHRDRVHLINTRIEDLEFENAYDVAVSINVFEHVDDWRTAIRRTLKALKPGGRAIILCPSYDVPYESHFGIPVIGSKSLTYRLFRSRIQRREHELNAVGLWNSLNFISGAEILRFCREQGFPCSFDRGIVPRMFRRVTEDAGFRNRRGSLAGWLIAAERAGLPAIMGRLPLRLQPYLKFELSRPQETGGAQA